ncbi:ABC-type multidrug transport system, ATPase and permease component [hydrothermal vent metagenome]|uniref:ABC-type multidrug transport system, ATPase and permease component n=1 Tax=hydrothermal vent metagenome TaxID=652676 RepID=A0A1W1B8P0_9ZZZZ
MMTTRCSIKKILKETLRYRDSLIKGNIVAILATLMTVTIPLFIPVLVDELLLHQGDKMIGWVRDHIFEMTLGGYVLFFLILTLVMRAAGFLLNTIQVKTFLGISKDISFNLRTRAIEHLKSVSLKEYEMVSPGAITSKLVTDINTIDSFIGTTVSKFIISVLTLLFTAIVLLMIHWQLAIFILITNPIVVFFTAKLARNVGKLKRAENSAVELFQSSLGETLELFHQIKAANKESFFFARIEDKASKLKDTSIDFGYKSDRAIRFSFLIFLGGYEIFRAVSILAVAYSSLSVGLMLAIFGYLWIMMTPTQDIINFQYALANAKAACKRVNDIFAMEIEPKVANPIDPFVDSSAASIEVRDLHFSYFPQKPILKSLSLTIPLGSKVALVGASGSGKTTLAHLLVGFYPVSDGTILYNGISEKDINLSTIRSNIHLILQHPKLFNDTMLFNLTLGREHSDDEIKRAIDIAQLDEVVEYLSDGLDTLVGKDGIKLSGGQRQRVAIARMVLSDPKVVILDESTSALDIHTETKLFDALAQFLADKTVITIAHRISTIKSAELIFVLENGEMVDSGTPQELMQIDSSYFSSMV